MGYLLHLLLAMAALVAADEGHALRSTWGGFLALPLALLPVALGALIQRWLVRGRFRAALHAERALIHSPVVLHAAAVLAFDWLGFLAREVGLEVSLAGWPGFETQTGQFDEGFSLELSPLLSMDEGTIDAVLKCNIDQVEELVPVVIDVPTQAAPRQRTKIDVPQISHCRVHERFRWPANQVLIISLGMVATPVPVTDANPFKLPLPGTMGPPRADLLVIVENRGKVGQAPAVTRAGGGQVKAYHGRY